MRTDCGARSWRRPRSAGGRAAALTARLVERRTTGVLLTAQAPAERGPIKIGFLVPLSGGLAWSSGVVFVTSPIAG